MNLDAPNPVPSPARQKWLILAIAGSLVMTGVLLFGVWLPLRARTAETRERYREQRALIDAASEQSPEAELLREVKRAENVNHMLQTELDYWLERRNTFTRERPFAQISAGQDEGRIDFKVALYNARTGLIARAASNQVQIPYTLGLDETIRTDTRVETALSQLAATVKLVNLAIDTGIPEIEHIQPLQPTLSTIGGRPGSRLREYPVALDVRCRFNSALTFLTHLAHPDSGFALNHFSLARGSLEGHTDLTLRLVASAGRPLPNRDSRFKSGIPPEPDATNHWQAAAARTGRRRVELDATHDSLLLTNTSPDRSP